MTCGPPRANSTSDASGPVVTRAAEMLHVPLVPGTVAEEKNPEDAIELPAPANSAFPEVNAVPSESVTSPVRKIRPGVRGVSTRSSGQSRGAVTGKVDTALSEPSAGVTSMR